MTPGTQTRMAAWLESAWLARYLDRQLEGEELAWFEAYLLDKPELVEAVEADNLMREGIANHRSPTAAQAFKLPNVRRPAILAVAACACVAMGVVLGQFHATRHAGDLVANPTRLVLETERGSGASHLRSSGAKDSPYVLVEIAVPLYSTDIQLETQGRSIALAPSPDGFVSFLVPRTRPEVRKDIVIRYRLNGKVEKIEVPTTNLEADHDFRE